MMSAFRRLVRSSAYLAVVAAWLATAPRLAAAQISSPPRAAKAAKATKAAMADSVAPAPKAESRWPVKGPEPLPGSILPARRIVAFYGNPLSKRMGILGELPPDKMLAKLDQEVARWRAADPNRPVVPALHLVTIVAQASPGSSGKYRLLMADTLIERVVSWAATRDALVFLDIQVGKSTVQDEIPRLAKFLQRPNVHLGLDPEFSMKRGGKPGARMGTMSASDINFATAYLADLVAKHNLPPKVLVVHRFTRDMLTGTKNIRLDPRVQIVIDMDGWGPPTLKKDSYKAYIYNEPVQFTGFKLFYKNDSKRGHPLMKPEEVLQLVPAPVYIQYQ